MDAKKRHRDDATDELASKDDSTTAKKIVALIKEGGKPFRFACFEQSWNWCVRIEIRDLELVDTRLLSSILSVNTIWNITLEIPEQQDSVSMDISFYKSVLSVSMPRYQVIPKEGADIEFKRDSFAQLVGLPEEFQDRDFPYLKEVVDRVYNMNAFLPLIHHEFSYLDNEYTLSFTGMRRIEYDFLEYLFCTYERLVSFQFTPLGGLELRFTSLKDVPSRPRFLRDSTRPTQVTSSVKRPGLFKRIARRLLG